MKSIKKLKGIIAILLLSGATSVTVTSCGSLSNMSDVDAIVIGAGTGALLKNIIDN